jgi:septum formation protein
MPFVLASASPRRRELLRAAGIDFIVQPADIPELRLSGETAKAFAERMAKEKATAVWNSLANPHPSNTAKGGAADIWNGALNPKIQNAQKQTVAAKEISVMLFVLGADTIVVSGDEVLGKPTDARDAIRMLGLLSARGHDVITGVCLRGDGFEDVRSETTGVYFRELSELEISSYIESGEPMDKAGAYAIQGLASRWISKIEGDYNNVVGLPVELVRRMLREHGLG